VGCVNKKARFKETETEQKGLFNDPPGSKSKSRLLQNGLSFGKAIFITCPFALEV